MQPSPLNKTVQPPSLHRSSIALRALTAALTIGQAVGALAGESEKVKHDVGDPTVVAALTDDCISDASVNAEQVLGRLISENRVLPVSKWKIPPTTVPENFSEGNVLRFETNEHANSKVGAQENRWRRAGTEFALRSFSEEWFSENIKLRYQAVFVDTQGGVHLRSERARDSASRLFLPPKDVEIASVGLLSLDARELKEFQERAYARAKERGLQILSPPPGKPAPYNSGVDSEWSDFEVEVLNPVSGQTQVLNEDSQRNRLTVFLDWATYCTSCKVHIQDLIQEQKNSPEDLDVVLVTHDATSDLRRARRMLLEFFGAHDMKWPENWSIVEAPKDQIKGVLWRESVRGISEYSLPNGYVIQDGIFHAYIGPPNPKKPLSGRLDRIRAASAELKRSANSSN